MLTNAAKEATPLLSTQLSPDEMTEDGKLWGIPQKNTFKEKVYRFLEAKTPAGSNYEAFTFFLILASITSFILGTLFVPKYNPASYAGTACGILCDALWFGNYEHNALSFLRLGPTSALEIFTVFVFSVDYLLRFWTADLEDEKYAGFCGRLRYLASFYSIVDLASTVPFYVDIALINTNLASSQFLRMFRLFRMMKVEGRFLTALTLFDDVFYEQRGILGTALFVGMTTWVAVSSLYYFAERHNTDMIYCGAASSVCETDVDDLDTSLCAIDLFGFVNCTAAGCPATEDFPEPCYNLYRSIPSSSYYSLLNLFGEFPLIDQHSSMGKVVGVIVAVVAVAVFALPVGIVGNGFEDLLERRRESQMREENQLSMLEIKKLAVEQEDQFTQIQDTRGDGTTLLGRMYNFFHAMLSPFADAYNHFLNLLVIGTSLTFMLGTTQVFAGNSLAIVVSNYFEFFSVIVFTFDYLAKVYCISENTSYAGLQGRLLYASSFLLLVDLLSFAPYWVVVAFSLPNGNIVKCMRLLRVFRFERYTKAFTLFGEVFRVQKDVFIVTGVAALIMWVFFSAVMYLTDRSNPDEEVARYYSSVPQAMWMTLLNLSGESPLCNYSFWGKITTGVIGIFATGLFGIPIGILGAGFQELTEEKTTDTPDEDEPITRGPNRRNLMDRSRSYMASAESNVFHFVNGEGSTSALYFEGMIYFLIFLTVFIGIIQTMEGQENFLHIMEWIAVFVFTFEYALRLFAAPADPEFKSEGVTNGFVSRIQYIFSFYSIIDLAAIVPMYLAYMLPDSWIDQHDEYLRMLRLVRLVKLDKYVPSISLIDDVIRLKRKTLAVTGYAAVTLWIIFSGLLYVFEYKDYTHGIDDVPVYGCDSDCTMSDRFKNYFDSLIYTGIHLTGDYPVIEYGIPGRVTCFFMVIVAVGVVSVPSGLIADGFAQIVHSRSKSKGVVEGNTDEDWYEYQLSLLKKNDCSPPLSCLGPFADSLQVRVHEFLNGKEDGATGDIVWTPLASFCRSSFLALIVANIFAVFVESVPEIDRSVGNEPGNAFAVFEVFSIVIFTAEYLLGLFSAQKNRNALYSTRVYATTFFGLVDLLSIAPFFVEQILVRTGHLDEDSDSAMVFRIFRIFRILQLEDFIIAFSKLDNVFRASKDVFKATGLLALTIWVGCGALFFIFEQGNPNWRECDESIPLHSSTNMGCYDFSTTEKCSEHYGEGMCTQTAFVDMPDSLYYTAVFLVGEWGLVDFTWGGRFVCMFLCVAGIALYAIPVGTLFDSFGAILGMTEDEEEDEED